MVALGRRSADSYTLRIEVTEGSGRVSVEYWATYVQGWGQQRQERISQQGFSAARNRSPEKVHTLVVVTGQVQILHAEEVAENGK